MSARKRCYRHGNFPVGHCALHLAVGYCHLHIGTRGLPTEQVHVLNKICLKGERLGRTHELAPCNRLWSDHARAQPSIQAPSSALPVADMCWPS
jgi:hypothetical protein